MTSAEINTKAVSGRRRVHYDSYDEALADAERLAAIPVRTLGNWSYGQILRHLAKTVNMTIDGTSLKAPAPIRLLARLFLKKRMLTRTLSPGFRLPKRARSLLPEETSVAEGLELFRAAVQRTRTESQRAPSPLLGKLTPEEADQFQLRHIEMHMSFVVPADESDASSD